LEVTTQSAVFLKRLCQAPCLPNYGASHHGPDVQLSCELEPAVVKRWCFNFGCSLHREGVEVVQIIHSFPDQQPKQLSCVRENDPDSSSTDLRHARGSRGNLHAADFEQRGPQEP
jgi:hypothetical protein